VRPLSPRAGASAAGAAQGASTTAPPTSQAAHAHRPHDEPRRWPLPGRDPVCRRAREANSLMSVQVPPGSRRSRRGRRGVLRRNGHPRVKERGEPATDDRDSMETRPHQLQRHTGAGGLVGSGAISDDLTVGFHVNPERFHVRMVDVEMHRAGRLNR
jgi:hypothetical protein